MSEPTNIVSFPPRTGQGEDSPAPPYAELAAATGVASMILSLDETITKN